MQPQTRETDNSLVISYLELRKFVGLLGFFMPFILAIGGFFTAVEGGIQPTISDYYYTPMRNLFVGILCSIGVFLFSYRGYPSAGDQLRKPLISDNAAGNLAALFAVGVALFPTTPVSPIENQALIGRLHLGCAAAMFFTLAYFPLCLFTQSAPGKTQTRMKQWRNVVYKTCGWAILAAIGLIVAVKFLPKPWFSRIEPFKPVFWLEALVVCAFGISWLTKGETLLKDNPNPALARAHAG